MILDSIIESLNLSCYSCIKLKSINVSRCIKKNLSFKSIKNILLDKIY